MSTLICIVVFKKAFLYYLIVTVLHYNKYNFFQPFNKKSDTFIFNVSYLTLGIDLFSY